MTLTYRGNVDSPSCLMAGDYSETVNVAGNTGLIRNFRLATGPVPAKWCGSLVVTSNQPVGGFVQLTNTQGAPYPAGDTFMVHSGINAAYVPLP